MSELRRYNVTQTKEVTVEARNSADARALAICAFEKGQTSAGKLYSDIAPIGVDGNTTSQVTLAGILVEKVKD